MKCSSKIERIIAESTMSINLCVVHRRSTISQSAKAFYSSSSLNEPIIPNHGKSFACNWNVYIFLQFNFFHWICKNLFPYFARFVWYCCFSFICLHRSCSLKGKPIIADRVREWERWGKVFEIECVRENTGNVLWFSHRAAFKEESR